MIDPDSMVWLPFSVNYGHLELRAYERALLSSFSFLDKRARNAGAKIMSAEEFCRTSKGAPPIGLLVMHHGFTGSSTFARQLAAACKGLALLEPYIFTDLSDYPSKTNDPVLLKAIAAAFGQTEPAGKTVVKLHDRCGPIGAEMIKMGLAQAALILVDDPRSFIVSALKGPQRRRWLLDGVAWSTRQASVQRILGDPLSATVSVSRLAAYYWLSNAVLFSETVRNSSPAVSVVPATWKRDGNVDAALERIRICLPPYLMDNIGNRRRPTHNLEDISDAKRPGEHWNAGATAELNRRVYEAHRDDIENTVNWVREQPAVDSLVEPFCAALFAD